MTVNRRVSTIVVSASTPKEIEESVTVAQTGPLPPDIHQTLENLPKMNNLEKTWYQG